MDQYHIPHLGVKADDKKLGLLVVWRCPQCEKTQPFYLYSSTVAMRFMAIKFSRSKEIRDVRCEKCHYEIKVSEADYPKLVAMAEATAQYTKGKFTYEQYRNALQQQDTQLFNDLLALTENWKCPYCGEENPVSFDKCWKCSETEPTEEKIEGGTQDNVDLPGLGKGGNPWEQ